ncbi:MAG: Crp/Fnr family transcriptional regulator [Cyclobacteriaceae bacterium]|jgi:CRP-like cAMP-binding protein|nr:Crp/Fnr family transcriptional regulator [Flammeovirgaceae bacterium]
MGLIESKILEKYGAGRIHLHKGAGVFYEGEEAQYYFQIAEGSVKMITRSEEGQEFIQGIFYKGESFGEPPLLCNFLYPSTAFTLEHCTIWKLPKEQFYNLLKDHFEVHLRMDQVLCDRLRYKNKILTSIAFDSPEKRVWWLLNYLKQKSGSSSSFTYEIPLTRQQIGDMVGMRVETIIRTVKKLEEAEKICLINHKIFI